MNLKSIMLSERSQILKTVVPFIWNSRNGKSTVAEFQWLLGAKKESKKLTPKAKGTLCGEENIIYFDCCSGYMTAYICQHAS